MDVRTKFVEIGDVNLYTNNLNLYTHNLYTHNCVVSGASFLTEDLLEYDILHREM